MTTFMPETPAAAPEQTGSNRRITDLRTGGDLALPLWAPATGTAQVQMNKPAPATGRGSPDRELIGRAIQIIEDADFADPRERDLSVASLAAIACRLWESASQASSLHQQILSAIDNAAICLATGTEPTEDRLSAVREALIDLRLATLTPSNVETINSRLIDVGFSPFPEISELPYDAT